MGRAQVSVSVEDATQAGSPRALLFWADRARTNLANHPVRTQEPAQVVRPAFGEGNTIAATTQTARLSCAEYLERLLKSRLISETQLVPLAGRLPRPNEPTAATRLAKALIEAGLLTPWQNDHILAGHWSGFFIGKHKLLARIGVGGMGTVYLAEHTIMRRKVAIKVLPKANIGRASYLERFLREARAIAALDHPNIIHAYNIDNDGDLHYMVLEYVEGPNLDQLVAGKGPLEFEDAADYIRQAAEGLAQAHERGLVHRDVKPSNLLLDQSGVVKILDMGLARLTAPGESSLTLEQGERVLGTADYLSPEQAIDSHDIDHRSDLYSLGCTFYYLLTGKTPFPNGTLAQRLVAHQAQPAPPPTRLRPDTPPELKAICMRLLEKRPEDRYPSASDLAQVLAAWLALRARDRREKQGRSAPLPGDLALVFTENDTRCRSNSDTNIRWFADEVRGKQAAPPVPPVAPAKSSPSLPPPPPPVAAPLAFPLSAVLEVRDDLDEIDEEEEEGDSVDGFVAELGLQYRPSVTYVARTRARNTLELLVWSLAAALVTLLVGILLRR